MSLRNEFLNGLMSGVRLSTCPRFLTRKMSRLPQIFLRSELLHGGVNRCHQDLKPRRKFAADCGADDRRDQNLRQTRRGLAAYTQFLDDTRHEPLSRISQSTRELKRIVSFFESVKEKMYSAKLGARG